jgi:hypothetical protein
MIGALAAQPGERPVATFGATAGFVSLDESRPVRQRTVLAIFFTPTSNLAPIEVRVRHDGQWRGPAKWPPGLEFRIPFDILSHVEIRGRPGDVLDLLGYSVDPKEAA